MSVLRVSRNTSPRDFANSIINAFKEDNYKSPKEVTFMGAQAVDRAVKGIIIARGKAAQMGYDIGILPTFCDINVENTEGVVEKYRGIKFILVWHEINKKPFYQDVNSN